MVKVSFQGIGAEESEKCRTFALKNHKNLEKDMENMLNALSDWIVAVSDTLCGYPYFFLLIGGGLFLFLYSGAVSIRRLPRAMRALRDKQASDQGKQ